jgi:DNA invertase Pin-like site-specific DNA recombinase
MKIGYARVSTDAQDYAAQVEALRSAGCEKITQRKSAAPRSKEGRRCV